MGLTLNPGKGWPPAGQPALVWLGQAGFWIDTGAHRILIDPYLSDSLLRKYPDRPDTYRRMMPPPALPDSIPRPDIVLVTHAHTDHMDPETLAPLARRFPDLPFIVPLARLDMARDRIGAQAQIVGMDAGDYLHPLRGLAITAFPAAHETREVDAEGRHHFLGYGIATDRLRFYHSGDTIPFDDLTRAVTAFAPQIALLPVNGRDAARLAAGVPGNMTLPEAVKMARAVGADSLLPHHFGMFSFNTCDPALIDAAASATDLPRIIRPDAGQPLLIR
jgi:L-ascorbate metabolism protein UlaG (beta-lactamase superfamily)